LCIRKLEDNLIVPTAATETSILLGRLADLWIDFRNIAL